MKKIIKKFNDFITEELSFSPLVVKYHDYHFKTLAQYNFVYEGNKIVVEFEKTEYGYVRAYKVNKTYTKKIMDNGNNIIRAVSFITLEFLKRYNPELLIIFHLPDGEKNTPNKRAKINKLYLSDLVSELGYSYELYSSHYHKNEEFSFIFKNINIVDKFKENIFEYIDEVS